MMKMTQNTEWSYVLFNVTDVFESIMNFNKVINGLIKISPTVTGRRSIKTIKNEPIDRMSLL